MMSSGFCIAADRHRPAARRLRTFIAPVDRPCQSPGLLGTPVLAEINWSRAVHKIFLGVAILRRKRLISEPGPQALGHFLGADIDQRLRPEPLEIRGIAAVERLRVGAADQLEHDLEPVLA